METQSKSTQQRRGSLPEEDFDQLSQLDMIEHLTVPAFLRRIPYKWHLDEITRFGSKVGKAAESLQLSYMTTIDRSLGVIRVFPAPLLNRIYQILAPQFGWPQIIELAPPALDDARRIQQETLRSHERMSKTMRNLLPFAESVDIQHSIAVVIDWLEHECARLRKELGTVDEQEKAAA